MGEPPPSWTGASEPNPLGHMHLNEHTAICGGPQVYGIFRNRRMATHALILIADEDRLCHTLRNRIARATGCD